MEPVSRRIFFKQAGVASALAAVAVASSGVAAGPLGLANAGASTALKSANSNDSELSPNEHLRGDEDLVAHVKNSRSGEISLFIGRKEVTIHDRKVAARLIRATR